MMKKMLLILSVAALSLLAITPALAGVTTANGWYEGEEIYYILGPFEENIPDRALNQIYLIGGDRKYQGNVVLHVPGEPGYTPHWYVNLVNTTEGTTAQDILDAGYGSTHFNEEGVLFDDVADILAAKDSGLVTITQPGLVVFCPILSERGAEAPGNVEASEDFDPFDLDAGF
jgi:hypothetical protein